MVLWTGHWACVLTTCQYPMPFSTLIKVLNAEVTICTTLPITVFRPGTKKSTLVLIEWFITSPCCYVLAQRHWHQTPRHVLLPTIPAAPRHIRTSWCKSLNLAKEDILLTHWTKHMPLGVTMPRPETNNLSNSPRHGGFWKKKKKLFHYSTNITSTKRNNARNYQWVFLAEESLFLAVSW